MSKVIIIEKNKTITETICSDLDELYKKCKFKKPDNFIKIHEFSQSRLHNMKYCLYGRLQGKSATINEYRFSGFDKKIYGACAVILTNLDNKMVDIIADDWIKYNTSKIVIDIQAEINNIIIKDDNDNQNNDNQNNDNQNNDNQNNDNQNNDNQNNDKDNQYLEERQEQEQEDDFKLNYGSELSEDMYIYSSDDE